MPLSRILFLLLLAIAWVPLALPARAEAAATIKNDTGYFSSPTYYVFGEVLNVGDAPIYTIVVEATFKDSNGATVSKQSNSAMTAYLPPNEKAPFIILEWNYSKARLVESYTLTLTFHVVPEKLLKTKQLEMLNVTSRMKGTRYFEVSGILKNNAPTHTGNVRVAATFYDGSGKVTYVAFTCVPGPCPLAPVEGIPPGGVDDFVLTVWDRYISERIVDFKLLAESGQYTSIPEWPSPTLVAASALVIVGLTSAKLSRRKIRRGSRI